MNKTEKSDYWIEPGQKYEIDLFQSDDAEGVVNLFLSVYGKGYPIRTYIEKDKLISENKAGTTISSVARTYDGDIVGHIALYQSSPYKKIFETGAGVVHKNYRGGKGIITGMVAHALGIAARQHEIEGIFGETVCNHVITQKLYAKLGFTATALELDLMPASAYLKEKEAPGRVSSLLEFKTIKPEPHKVYLPSEYREMLLFIYDGFDDEREIIFSEEIFPENSFSIINTQIYSFAQVARISIVKSGRDLLKLFEKEEQTANEMGVTLFQVWVNLGEPWAVETARLLKARGYFPGGIFPRWFNRDGLLMMKTLHRPNWEELQLLTERAKMITAFVRSEWEALKG